MIFIIPNIPSSSAVMLPNTIMVLPPKYKVKPTYFAYEFFPFELCTEIYFRLITGRMLLSQVKSKLMN